MTARPAEHTPPHHHHDARDRLRLELLNAASVIDVALDEAPRVRMAMLVELVGRLEDVLDTTVVAA